MFTCFHNYPKRTHASFLRIVRLQESPFFQIWKNFNFTIRNTQIYLTSESFSLLKAYLKDGFKETQTLLFSIFFLDTKFASYVCTKQNYKCTFPLFWQSILYKRAEILKMASRLNSPERNLFFLIFQWNMKWFKPVLTQLSFNYIYLIILYKFFLFI